MTYTEAESAETSTPNLDIFNFRNEIIGDYKRYIESFLKIRDTRSVALRAIAK
ncbi:MAG: hypothetical protein AAF915_23870 [Cyanobacteria bacterium P01_D01_bin.50]